jgi:hypothetical protein
VLPPFEYVTQLGVKITAFSRAFFSVGAGEALCPSGCICIGKSFAAGDGNSFPKMSFVLHG